MAKGLNYLNSFLHVAFGIFFLTLLISEFYNIRQASQILLERSGTLVSFKAAGIEVNFDHRAVAQGLDAAKQLAIKLGGDQISRADENIVLNAINALDSKEFVRLMAVGQLDNLCEYEHPTIEMRSAIALDYELQAKGLIAIEERSDILEHVQDIRRKTPREVSDIGAPRSCYVLTLTQIGSRVKTVIVETLAPAFVKQGLTPNNTARHEV